MNIKDIVINTPIHKIKSLYGTSNSIYVKRDDLQPFSFGGNKVRIGQKLLMETVKQGYDTLIIYGSRRSNLCRVTSNLAASMDIPCYMLSIIDDDHGCEEAFNGRFCEMFGTNIIRCTKAESADVVEKLKAKLIKEGRNPYYMNDMDAVITECTAYRDAYKEIERYQQENGVLFDYIFHASGSATTQAGLIIGKLISDVRGIDGEPDPTVVGISIARLPERGREVLVRNVKAYFEKYPYKYLVEGDVEKQVEFYTGMLCGGYGQYNDEIAQNCKNMLKINGFELDTTYTGKAYTGMEHYLMENNIEGKNVLFIHTGGLPLYFDYLNEG